MKEPSVTAATTTPTTARVLVVDDVQSMCEMLAERLITLLT